MKNCRSYFFMVYAQKQIDFYQFFVRKFGFVRLNWVSFLWEWHLFLLKFLVTSSTLAKLEMAKKYPFEFVLPFQHFRNLQEYSVDVNLLVRIMHYSCLSFLPVPLKKYSSNLEKPRHWGPAKSHIVQKIWI